MTGDPTALVVTLVSRSAAGSVREAELAREAGADLAEVRFDRWPADERVRAPELFPSPLPLLATLRSRAEGGEGPETPSERATVLDELARLPFDWLDLEAGRDDLGRWSDPPPRGSTPGGPRLVVSSHFPAGTSVAVLEAALRDPVPADAVRKVVAPMPLGPVLSELVPDLERGARPSGATVLTTGGSGPILRALGRRLALPFVFARLPDSGEPREEVEPAQLPVDRLRRFFQAGPSAPLVALLGRPVGHSLSPRVHHAWMDATGRVALYLALEVESPGELEVALARLPALGFRGANVTHPWKSAALDLADRRSRAAEDCGAANLLTFEGGRTIADNSDAGAVERRLEELRTTGRWSGDRLAVLGSGAAAAATLAAARRLGATAVVFARHRESALRLAGQFGAEVGGARGPRAFDLVVHATPVGRNRTGPLDLPLASLARSGSYVLDWVYGASDGEVARVARERGAAYEGGERLLVYQAARSFETWWGTGPPPAAVERVLGEVGCGA